MIKLFFGNKELDVPNQFDPPKKSFVNHESIKTFMVFHLKEDIKSFLSGSEIIKSEFEDVS